VVVTSCGNSLALADLLAAGDTEGYRVFETAGV
jgi:hypothetical protein